MQKRLIAMMLLSLAATAARGQSPEAAELWEKPYALSIQDNSFFIEEAFNQEERVMQHISSLTFFRTPVREIGYNFTQEWPAGGVKHQLSFEIPYGSLDGVSGLGDLAVNYRYQLLDKPDGVAFAPRFSVIFPTGDASRALGAGAMGFEANLPASKRLSESIVAHLNAGAALYPSVEVTVSDFDPVDPSFRTVRRAISEYFIGGSVIYLSHPNVNLMVEWISFFSGEPDPAGEVVLAASHIISPGVRAALNFDNLQIVPGVAVPVRLHSGESDAGIFGYLSFEHGF